MIESATALAFSVYENKGVYALLLGSGLSRAAHIPTGWEITIDLIRRVALLEGADEQADWAVWYREKYKKEPNYSGVLDLVANTPEERRSILHSYIEPSTEDIAEGRKVPTKAHRAIAELIRDGVFRVIITTNFDRLLESALREVGIEPTVVKSDDDLRGAVPIAHSRCYILKLHGDYLDTRIKNTDKELGTYSAEINSVLDRVFDEYGLIVCGWSGEWDEALRAAVARAPSRRFSIFWTTRRDPSAFARDLIQHRAARVVSIADADTFFETLQRDVSSQAELQRKNPQSIELLLASAKKFLPRPEYRIQFDELIGQESRKLNEIISSKQLDPNAAWSNVKFTGTVSLYEAATEPMARLFGILGRWGRGDEFETVAEIIRGLARRPTTGGLVILIGLRTYPALLLLYAYGLGLLKAGRYTEILKIFSIKSEPEHGDPAVLADEIFCRWEGNDNNVWRNLPGFEQRKTALSDHLHELFKTWTADYMFVSSDFTRLFETLELLGGLAYLTSSIDETDLKTSAANQNIVWTSMGRAGWDGTNCRAVLKSWQQEETYRAMLNAGFARGSLEYLRAAVKNFQLIAGRYQW
jgi:hypothetical protein